MDLFLPAICPLWVLVRATDLVVAAATGSSCKAKNLLRRTQESFHLVLALSTALSSAAAWEFSMKRSFEQKRDLYQATVLYILGKCLLRKPRQIPTGLGRAACEQPAFLQPGTCQGQGRAGTSTWHLLILNGCQNHRAATYTGTSIDSGFCAESVKRCLFQLSVNTAALWKA